ncbi:MAG: hypothetical protein AB1454_12600 [Candidatus Auribacterota bacterium]
MEEPYYLFYSINHASQFLGITRQGLNRRIREGEMRFLQIGRSKFLSLEDITATNKKFLIIVEENENLDFLWRLNRIIKERFLTVCSTAKILNMSRQAVLKKIQKKQLPAIMISKRIYLIPELALKIIKKYGANKKMLLHYENKWEKYYNFLQKIIIFDNENDFDATRLKHL